MIRQLLSVTARLYEMMGYRISLDRFDDPKSVINLNPFKPGCAPKGYAVTALFGDIRRVVAVLRI